MEQVAKVAMFFIPFLFSLCFHEFAHGWMAKRKGDNTAELMGRLNLNPLSHIDWIGTVALPIMAIIFHLPLFGWAKPVPVNPRNLRKPKEDMFWIALAGPVSNILLYAFGVLLIFLIHNLGLLQGVVEPGLMKILDEMLFMFLVLNLFLALFNMLPLHPLDGGKVMARFLPYNANRWLEENQNILNMALIMLIILGALRFVAIPVIFAARLSWGLASGAIL